MLLSIFIIIWGLSAFVIHSKVESVVRPANKNVLYRIITSPIALAHFVVDKVPASFSQKLTDWFAK